MTKDHAKKIIKLPKRTFKKCKHIQPHIMLLNVKLITLSIFLKFAFSFNVSPFPLPIKIPIDSITANTYLEV